MELAADELKTVDVLALGLEEAEDAAIAAICCDDTTVIEIVTATCYDAGRYRVVARTRHIEPLPAELEP